jgi:DNA-binding response OmpR family regulator
VVDDDPDMRSLIADELGEEGCRIFQAKNGVDALSLKRTLPECPAIVITAFGDSRTRAKVMESGMAGYFDKPVRMGDLKSLVKKVCLVQNCVFDRSSDLMQF